MAPIMARPCIQYNLDIKLTGLLHRLRLNFRCVDLLAAFTREMEIYYGRYNTKQTI